MCTCITLSHIKHKSLYSEKKIISEINRFMAMHHLKRKMSLLDYSDFVSFRNSNKQSIVCQAHRVCFI